MTDLALVNAKVLTMDPDRPRASAVAITGGRIEALDASLDSLNEAGRVVDLRGATVLPGFHDAHNHMIGFGMSLAEVDLRSSAVGSLDELYAAIARRAETTAPGEWVVGPATTRTSSALTRTGTPSTGPRRGGGSGCGIPPATCAW